MDHETFLQKMIAVGIALRFIRKTLPQQYKGSVIALSDVIDITERLRVLPPWRKWVLNMLL
jgi:hypothetical protein